MVAAMKPVKVWVLKAMDGLPVEVLVTEPAKYPSWVQTTEQMFLIPTADLEALVKKAYDYADEIAREYGPGVLSDFRAFLASLGLDGLGVEHD